jgi:hypothetical protein
MEIPNFYLQKILFFKQNHHQKNSLLMNIIILSLLFGVILMSCKDQSTGLLSLEIEKSAKSIVEISISEIAGELEYIRLETSERCIVGNNPKVFATQIHIIVIANNTIMLFDRTTGNYIRSIGQEGQGPGEYNSVSWLLPIRYDENRVMAIGNQKIIEYGFDGAFLREVSVLQGINYSVLLDEKHFVSYFPNYTGDIETKVAVYTLDGNETATYPNYQKAPRDGDSFSMWMPAAWFFRKEGELYFTELFNDTVYAITPTEISPCMVLGLGQYLPPYEQQNLSSFYPRANDFFMLRTVFESSRFIFYTYRYKEESYVAIYDRMHSNTSTTFNNGFLNNIDNFISIPLGSINESDEMLGIINAYEVAQWFDANKAVELPGNLANLKSMTDNDNPLVVIAKLKK